MATTYRKLGSSVEEVSTSLSCLSLSSRESSPDSTVSGRQISLEKDSILASHALYQYFKQAVQVVAYQKHYHHGKEYYRTASFPPHVLSTMVAKVESVARNEFPGLSLDVSYLDSVTLYMAKESLTELKHSTTDYQRYIDLNQDVYSFMEEYTGFLYQKIRTFTEERQEHLEAAKHAQTQSEAHYELAAFFQIYQDFSGVLSLKAMHVLVKGIDKSKPKDEVVSLLIKALHKDCSKLGKNESMAEVKREFEAFIFQEGLPGQVYDLVHRMIEEGYTTPEQLHNYCIETQQAWIKVASEEKSAADLSNERLKGLGPLRELAPLAARRATGVIHGLRSQLVEAKPPWFEEAQEKIIRKSLLLLEDCRDKEKEELEKLLDAESHLWMEMIRKECTEKESDLKEEMEVAFQECLKAPMGDLLDKGDLSTGDLGKAQFQLEQYARMVTLSMYTCWVKKHVSFQVSDKLSKHSQELAHHLRVQLDASSELKRISEKAGFNFEGELLAEAGLLRDGLFLM